MQLFVGIYLASMRVIRDRYRLIEKIGAGGQGEVWKAEDLLHSRHIALKSREIGDNDKHSVLGEARLLLDLTPHPGLPLVREDFFEDGMYWLAMDWIPGQSVQQMMDINQLPFEQSIDYLKQVAEALDHLHSHQPPAVHKDVKPANIVVTPEGRVVLVDFGISLRGDKGGHGNSGTRGFVAPEVSANHAPGAEADIYSLAATAFAMFCGEPPRPGLRPKYRGVGKESAKRLEVALARGLAFDPSARPSSAAEFVRSLRGEGSVANNLKLSLTAFIGREQEVKTVRKLLDKHRLVTIVGAGGLGKTRLAERVAADAIQSFPDGVWLIELGPLDEPGLVATEVGRVLSVQEKVDRTMEDSVVDRVGRETTLIVLDNCEHLLEGCAKLCEAVLGYCPNVSILATSRGPIGVEGERPFRLEPMPVTPETSDPESSEAVRLFIDRARLVADLKRDEESLAAIMRIVKHVDGIPLAIELAAARTTLMSVEDIAARIGDRFRLLSGGAKSRPSRQQSLRATIDWSYELLDDDERDAFRKLSVFSGGFDLDAASAVCGSDDIVDVLQQLSDRSLITVDPESKRFSLLETIRAYGREKLDIAGQTAKTRSQHLRFYAGFAQDAESSLGGPEQGATLDLLEQEHENMRAALAWAAESQDETGLQLGAALWRFWDVRGHLREGRAWTESMLDSFSGASDELKARGHRGAGGLAISQGDMAAATVHLKAAVDLARQAGLLPLAGASLNSLAIASSDVSRQEELFKEALEVWRQLGHTRGIAVTLGNLGTLALDRGDLELAQGLIQESLEIRRSLGDQHGIAASLNGAGVIASCRGETEISNQLLAEAIEVWDGLGYKRGAAIARANLASNAYYAGHQAKAVELYQESILSLRELDAARDLAESLCGLGESVAETESSRAKECLVESFELFSASNDRRGMAACLEAGSSILLAEGRTDDAATCWLAAAMLRSQVDPPVPADRVRQHNKALSFWSGRPLPVLSASPAPDPLKAVKLLLD